MLNSNSPCIKINISSPILIHIGLNKKIYLKINSLLNTSNKKINIIKLNYFFNKHSLVYYNNNKLLSKNKNFIFLNNLFISLYSNYSIKKFKSINTNLIQNNFSKLFSELIYKTYFFIKLKGIGFNAFKVNNLLRLNIGYRSKLFIKIQNSLSISFIKKTFFLIKGFNKIQTNSFGNFIWNLNHPDVYKGKGIYKKKQFLIKKAGKKRLV